MRLNSCYLKIVHILHPRYHSKIIGHVRLSVKAGMGIGERNEGKDGNAGNQGWMMGMSGTRVGIQAIRVGMKGIREVRVRTWGIGVGMRGIRGGNEGI